MMSPTSLLAVCIAFGATAHAAQCSTSDLETIAQNPHLRGCTSKIGFGSFTSYSTLTSEQIKQVCDNSDCVALIEDTRMMDLGDCVLEDTGILLNTDFLDPFHKACSGSGSVDSSSSNVGDASAGSATSGSSLSSFATKLSILWVSTAVAALMF